MPNEIPNERYLNVIAGMVAEKLGLTKEELVQGKADGSLTPEVIAQATADVIDDLMIELVPLHPMLDPPEILIEQSRTLFTADLRQQFGDYLDWTEQDPSEWTDTEAFREQMLFFREWSTRWMSLLYLMVVELVDRLEAANIADLLVDTRYNRFLEEVGLDTAMETTDEISDKDS
jgi:hypothetical protein